MPENLRSLADLVQLNESAIGAVLRGDIEPRTASTVGSLVRLHAELLVDSDIEERLQRLEEKQR